MKETERIRWQLKVGRDWLMALVQELTDEELLVQASPGKGNHALWVLGHLAWTEGALLYGYVKQGQPNPLEDWKDLFGMGSQPVSDAAKYPSRAEILARWDAVREELNRTLESLSEEDLARPTGAEQEFFSTVGNSLSAVATEKSNSTSRKRRSTLDGNR